MGSKIRTASRRAGGNLLGHWPTPAGLALWEGFRLGTSCSFLQLLTHSAKSKLSNSRFASFAVTDVLTVETGWERGRSMESGLGPVSAMGLHNCVKLGE